jgi:hypothetical protein
MGNGSGEATEDEEPRCELDGHEGHEGDGWNEAGSEVAEASSGPARGTSPGDSPTGVSFKPVE